MTVTILGMDTKTLHSDAYKALTQWLKAEREAQGLTLRELAERAKIYNSLIAKVEQQERNLSVVEFVQYCNALGIDPDEGIQIIQKALKPPRGKGR